MWLQIWGVLDQGNPYQPFHEVVVSNTTIAVMDMRYAHQPLLSWEMEDTPNPRFLHVLDDGDGTHCFNSIGRIHTMFVFHETYLRLG